MDQDFKGTTSKPEELDEKEEDKAEKVSYYWFIFDSWLFIDFNLIVIRKVMSSSAMWMRMN